MCNLGVINKENDALPSAYDHTVKSKESLEEARFVVFNKTQRRVDVLWVDYGAREQLYRTLPSGSGIQLNTFKTHPWIFRDCWSGLLMHVQHKEVFWPEAATEQQPFQRINIHLPIFSLKTLALWTAVLRIDKFSEIAQLHIPQTLRTDLETVYKIFHDHHVKMSQRIQRDRQNQQIQPNRQNQPNQ